MTREAFATALVGAAGGTGGIPGGDALASAVEIEAHRLTVRWARTFDPDHLQDAQRALERAVAGTRA